MKKELGKKDCLFPMPVALIGTYDENGTVDVMNMAWVTLCDFNMVLGNLDEGHKTAANLKNGSDFTLAIATEALVREADYFGIVSANDAPDKFARSGLHASPSRHVRAPVIEECPLTIECKLHKAGRDEDGNYLIYGEIVNVLADEAILDAAGKIDLARWRPLLYSSADHRYYATGEPRGDAFAIAKRSATASETRCRRLEHVSPHSRGGML